MLDEVEALLAGLRGDVESSPLARSQPRLEDGVVLRMDGQAGELVVVGPRRYLLMAELPSGAARR